MKKRLLITSIVMMLVVAVALSTATYAWFTSNDQVTANSITMTATTNSAPTIGISWTDGNYGTEITPTISNSLRFAPVAPAALTVGTTTSAVEFKTALAYSDEGVYKFVDDGADVATGDTDAYTWTDGEHNSFFLKNLSEANAINGNIYVSAVFTDEYIAVTGETANPTLYTYYDNNTGTVSDPQPEAGATVSTGYKKLNEVNKDLLRVGIFKKTSGSFKLLGVLANTMDTYSVVAKDAVLASEDGENDPITYYKKVLGKFVVAVAGSAQDVIDGIADYEADVTQAPENTFYTKTTAQTHAKAVYGDIDQDDPVNDMETIDCAEEINVATNLAANTSIELQVLVWMDAAALGNNQQLAVESIKLNFTIHS